MICPRCMGYMTLHFNLPGYRKCPTCAYTEKERKFMISMSELNPKGFKLTPEQQANLVILHEKINKIRDLWAKPMTVTSGVRDIADHIKIYKNKGITDESKIPMASRHLSGQAVDISDPKGELAKWCHDNVKHLEDIGLWCEATEDTNGWVHFQILAPASGKRFFHP